MIEYSLMISVFPFMFSLLQNTIDSEISTSSMPLVLYYQNYHCMLLSPESMDNLSWKMAKMLVRLCLSRGFAEIPVG